MSYARIEQTGTYIWSDGENVNFGIQSISNNDIDIFLYKLYKTRHKEFKQRVKNGKNLIKQHKGGINGSI